LNNSILNLAAVFMTGFLLTYLLTPIIAKIMSYFNKTGIDVHKLDKPKIPEACGISIIISMTVSVILLILLFPQFGTEFLAFIISGLIAGVIGFIDDLKGLGARMKPFLTAFSCIPILILGTYNPYPILPFIGKVRLTLVYPFLLPFALAVPANAVNMMDVFNGSMTATSGIILFTLFTCLMLAGKLEYAALALALLGCLIAFYLFNRYPAKVFAGDTGSLFIGASIGALAILGSIELVVIVALMPYIMNAFYGLSTVGRLYERRELKSRPIKLINNGKLAITKDKKAPMTLARLILVRGSLKEYEIVRKMCTLTAIASILAIITYLLTGAVRV